MTRKFTTADLENLTKDTTPGPWYTEGDGYGGFILLGSNPDRPYVYPHIGDMEEEADAKFVAAAPALAADYHRVRTGVEKLISQLAQNAAATLDGRALDLATELDHILNGDSHA